MDCRVNDASPITTGKVTLSWLFLISKFFMLIPNGTCSSGRSAPTAPLTSSIKPKLSAILQTSLRSVMLIPHAHVQIRSLGADSMANDAPPIWSSKPTMLIGIDVSHPQSFDKSEPSIVGIVASMDKSFAQCATRPRFYLILFLFAFHLIIFLNTVM